MAILIVDDNPRMRDMMRAVLEPVGQDIHECEDGADALEQFRRIRPSWVLMDVAMERMDGLAATRAIREFDPDAKVVIVTEHMEPALRRAATACGASAYVLKEDLSALLEVLMPGQQLQRALHASEQRYRQLFDGLPVGLYRSTPGGIILDANEALVTILGCSSRDRLIHSSALQFYADPADRQRWRERMDRDGVVRDFDVRVRGCDGELIWLRHSARVVNDDRGQPLFYEGALQDVTRQKEAEDALRASEERYRSYIAQSAEGVWRLELEQPLNTSLPVQDQIDHLFSHAYIAECNDAMARMYGCSVAAEFVGTRLEQILLRPDHTNEQHLLLLIAHGYQLADAETREVTRDGQVRIFESNLTGIIEAGLLVRIWGTQRDVTKRHQLDDALRRSEERFHELYDNTPSMYFTVDVGGNVQSVNRFGAAHLGYEAEDLVGRSVLQVFHKDDREAAFDHIAQCVCQPGKALQWELRKVRRDGSELWVKETARAIRNPAGTVVLIVCQDITEHKLVERQLRQSETVAAIGSLVMGVAHEVRNPLHALLGTMDLIEAEGSLPGHVRDSFQVLRSQVDRLQRLMRDLLEYGKPAPLELRPEDVGEVLNEALLHCDALARRRSVRLVPVVGKLPRLALDRTRMVQVFTNILENALALAPAQSEVEVSASPSADGAWVECRIADRGPGFKPGDIGRVFEPFFTRRPGGTGLGLSIVQRIVAEHGGHVAAENVPGGGAVVAVRLPLSGAPGVPA